MSNYEIIHHQQAFMTISTGEKAESKFKSTVAGFEIENMSKDI